MVNAVRQQSDARPVLADNTGRQKVPHNIRAYPSSRGGGRCSGKDRRHKRREERREARAGGHEGTRYQMRQP